MSYQVKMSYQEKISSAVIYKSNQGVALVVSLVLLVAMTVIALATLSGTRLNERIASNAQQKAISFEAAESAISRTWAIDELLAYLKQIPADQFNDPAAIESTTRNAELSELFDQTAKSGVGKSVDIAASVSIQYCGETLRPTGSELTADESGTRFAGALFDVNGAAQIVGSKAMSDHVQRGYVIRPQTGRSGNCATPGS